MSLLLSCCSVEIWAAAESNQSKWLGKARLVACKPYKPTADHAHHEGPVTNDNACNVVELATSLVAEVNGIAGL